MFKKFLSIILTIVLTVIWTFQPNPSFSQEMKRYTIAVLDLEASGISQSEASFLSQHLHAQITRVSTSDNFKNTTNIDYTVLERSQMYQIFEEFKVQDFACASDSCVIEKGKMLAAQRIIVGSVGLVGKTYSITTRIVDVQSGKTLSIADYTYSGPIDDLLTTGIQKVVNDLFFAEKKKSHKKVYIIAGTSAVVIGAVLAAMQNKSDGNPEKPGNIFIKIPVPED